MANLVVWNTYKVPQRFVCTMEYGYSEAHSHELTASDISDLEAFLATLPQVTSGWQWHESIDTEYDENDITNEPPQHVSTVDLLVEYNELSDEQKALYDNREEDEEWIADDAYDTWDEVYREYPYQLLEFKLDYGYGWYFDVEGHEFKWCEVSPSELLDTYEDADESAQHFIDSLIKNGTAPRW